MEAMMAAHGLIEVLTSLTVGAIAGAGLGLAMAVRDNLRAIERRLERRLDRLEREIADLTVFSLSIVRRMPTTPLSDDLTEKERLMWQQFADYFREERYP